MFKTIGIYDKISEKGNIVSVTQLVLDKSPEVQVNIQGRTVVPLLEWKNSVIKITYNNLDSTAVSYYRCCNLNTFNPDYLAKYLDASNSLYSTDIYNGVITEPDLKIIWGKLPKRLQSLRESIFDYVVDKHIDIQYTKEYHWPRAFCYCLQLLEASGLVGVYRVLQPIHCKNYDLIKCLIIPECITPNYIDSKAEALIDLVAKSKKELQDLGIPLETLKPLRDFIDSNKGLGTLLEGFCLIVLASLTKPKEFEGWIHQ